MSCVNSFTIIWSESCRILENVKRNCRAMNRHINNHFYSKKGEQVTYFLRGSFVLQERTASVSRGTAWYRKPPWLFVTYCSCWRNRFPCDTTWLVHSSTDRSAVARCGAARRLVTLFSQLTLQQLSNTDNSATITMHYIH